MTEFERITKSPEVLGEFLRSLPIIEGPWDEEFQQRFCSGCGKVSCDDGSRCPYEDKRNNPGWWLTLQAEKTESEAEPEQFYCEMPPEEAERPLAPEELQGAEDGVFGLIPDDESHTMVLCPMKPGETAVKLTVKTAKILIAILDRQIREWL